MQSNPNQQDDSWRSDRPGYFAGDREREPNGGTPDPPDNSGGGSMGSELGGEELKADYDPPENTVGGSQ